MTKFMVRCLLFVSFMSTSFFSFAKEKPKMADAMRSNGKIYVVVAVVLTILLGLIAYLIRLDRKISKLEKES